MLFRTKLLCKRAREQIKGAGKRRLGGYRGMSSVSHKNVQMKAMTDKESGRTQSLRVKVGSGRIRQKKTGKERKGLT